MTAAYTEAIEMRARWLRWAEIEDKRMKETVRKGQETEPYFRIFPGYMEVLKTADTFYMNSHFSALVDHARKEVPGDLAYDATWLQSPCGFIWLEQPFEVPPLQLSETSEELQEIVKHLSEHDQKDLTHLHAIGWRPIPAGTKMFIGPRMLPEVAPAGYTQFLFFQKRRVENSFGCWSYMGLRDGDKLNSRIDNFERNAAEDGDGAYSDLTHRVNELHEVRWLYAALHLMAQRFSVTVQHKPDRASRRRAEREGREIPPWIRVITLRRLEEAREKATASGDINWRWQWEVRGHWRNQWYESEGIHKPKFIEAYIKGPEGKPLKEGAVKLFTAVR